MLAETELAGNRALLVKPQTYYNGSGECLAAVLGYYKVPPSRLIVVHDELDLEAGRLRLKLGGSDAGNRGVRSVAQILGTPDFIRVRVGVSRPPGESESKDYLLVQRPRRRARISTIRFSGRRKQWKRSLPMAWSVRWDASISASEPQGKPSSPLVYVR